MGTYGMSSKKTTSTQNIAVGYTTGKHNTAVSNNPMNCSAYKIQLKLTTQQ